MARANSGAKMRLRVRCAREAPRHHTTSLRVTISKLQLEQNTSCPACGTEIQEPCNERTLRVGGGSRSGSLRVHVCLQDHGAASLRLRPLRVQHLCMCALSEESIE